MKVVLINKSDQTGGAAVVTKRLMEALRQEGIDARMIVVERLTDSPHIGSASSKWMTKVPFIAERLRIFLANGFNRADLFKVDIASDGLALWRHPWIKEADIVCLNWINQGMLSLKGIKRIADMGKPIVWTMHDMWNATGICHHAGVCKGFEQECGNCHLLGKCSAEGDLSHKVWRQKKALYDNVPIHFVAVSNWLANKCRQSSLMKDVDLSVIPNAFPIDKNFIERESLDENQPIKIVMGAARLDDPIKGFSTLIETLKLVKRLNPQLTDNLELVTFGSIRNPELFLQIPIKHTHLGTINNPGKIREIYRQCHIVVSSSHYETLPGTLIEGQADGCLPVAFDSGGQSDIINHEINGYLAPYSDDIHNNAKWLASGIFWAVDTIYSAKYGKIEARRDECGHTPPYNISRLTYDNVNRRFSASAVAQKYISLFNDLLAKR